VKQDSLHNYCGRLLLRKFI